MADTAQGARPKWATTLIRAIVLFFGGLFVTLVFGLIGGPVGTTLMAIGIGALIAGVLFGIVGAVRFLASRK